MNEDGFDTTDGERRVIRGTRLKFTDGRWTDGETSLPIPVDLRLLAYATVDILQRWKDGQATTIWPDADGKLPSYEELNKEIPIEEWEVGLDGKPHAFEPHWIVYFINPDPKSGEEFTYVNKTRGLERAVRILRDRVKSMRMLRGENVVPEVTLACRAMPTDFGTKMRPHFEVQDWRRFGGSTPQLPGGGGPKAIEHKRTDEPVKPVSTEEELSDSIPF